MNQDSGHKENKKTRKKWTPEMLALYLLSQNPMYCVPAISSKEIAEKFPELGIKERAIDNLRNDPVFDRTVKEYLVNRIKDSENLQKMFWTALQHIWKQTLQEEKPSYKILEILGWLTREYVPKDRPPEEKMTNEQKARLKAVLVAAERSRQTNENQRFNSENQRFNGENQRFNGEGNDAKA